MYFNYLYFNYFTTLVATHPNFMFCIQKYYRKALLQLPALTHLHQHF